MKSAPVEMGETGAIAPIQILFATVRQAGRAVKSIVAACLT